MCVGRMKKNRLNRFFDCGNLAGMPRISPEFMIEESSLQGSRAKQGLKCSRKERGLVYEKNQS